MWVFVRSLVCLFGWLFADSCLSVFPWLVGWFFVSTCACAFQHFAAHVRALQALFTTFFCLSCILYSIASPGAPLCHPDWNLLGISHTWRDLGAQIVDSLARLGRPQGHFGVCVRLWGRTLDAFFDLSGKRVRNRFEKDKERS